MAILINPRLARNVLPVGSRFGRLVVQGERFSIAKDARRKSGSRVRDVFAVCLCDCGQYSLVRVAELRIGKTRSCGCLQQEVCSERCKSLTGKTNGNYRHGDTHKRLHRIWLGMKGRCSSHSERAWKWYGSKGIKVFPEWDRSYEAFRDWALANGYRDDLTIDRIDNDGDYCPSNCQWITQAENVKKAVRQRKR